MSFGKEPKYHNIYTCNKCGKENLVTKVVDSCEGYVSEAETECYLCGFLDYWGYGFFESSTRGYNKCEKY